MNAIAPVNFSIYISGSIDFKLWHTYRGRPIRYTCTCQFKFWLTLLTQRQVSIMQALTFVSPHEWPWRQRVVQYDTCYLLHAQLVCFLMIRSQMIIIGLMYNKGCVLKCLHFGVLIMSRSFLRWDGVYTYGLMNLVYSKIHGLSLYIGLQSRETSPAKDSSFADVVSKFGSTFLHHHKGRVNSCHI